MTKQEYNSWIDSEFEKLEAALFGQKKTTKNESSAK